VASPPLSAMARNFVFTPPIRLCKKFKSKFFSCDWMRLINSYCVVVLHPPSLIFWANIPQKFSISPACTTIWGLVVLLQNGKFSFINAIVSLEERARAKSCTNWKFKPLCCLCMNGKSHGCKHYRFRYLQPMTYMGENKVWAFLDLIWFTTLVYF
jgi:hypothetical protein